MVEERVALKFKVNREGFPSNRFIRHQGSTQWLASQKKQKLLAPEKKKNHRVIRSWTRESWRTLVQVVEPLLQHLDQVIKGKPYFGLPPHAF